MLVAQLFQIFLPSTHVAAGWRYGLWHMALVLPWLGIFAILDNCLPPTFRNRFVADFGVVGTIAADACDDLINRNSVSNPSTKERDQKYNFYLRQIKYADYRNALSPQKTLAIEKPLLSIAWFLKKQFIALWEIPVIHYLTVADELLPEESVNPQLLYPIRIHMNRQE